jgi:hypothetical protein
MTARLSVLCLVVGLAVGYGVAAPPTKAQNAGLPFLLNAEDRLVLHFKAGALAAGTIAVECNVDEVQGMWVRCRSTDALQGAREQRWYNLGGVMLVKRQQR